MLEFISYQKNKHSQFLDKVIKIMIRQIRVQKFINKVKTCI